MDYLVGEHQEAHLHPVEHRRQEITMRSTRGGELTAAYSSERVRPAAPAPGTHAPAPGAPPGHFSEITKGGHLHHGGGGDHHLEHRPLARRRCSPP